MKKIILISLGIVILISLSIFIIYIYNSHSLYFVNINTNLKLPNCSYSKKIYDNGFQDSDEFYKFYYEDKKAISKIKKQLKENKNNYLKIYLNKIYKSLSNEEKKLFEKNIKIDYEKITYINQKIIVKEQQ